MGWNYFVLAAERYWKKEARVRGLFKEEKGYQSYFRCLAQRKIKRDWKVDQRIKGLRDIIIRKTSPWRSWR